jgi:hypothetical protein
LSPTSAASCRPHIVADQLTHTQCFTRHVVDHICLERSVGMVWAATAACIPARVDFGPRKGRNSTRAPHCRHRKSRRQKSRCEWSAGSTGRPAVIHACTPPTRSLTAVKPMRCRLAAPIDEL